MEQIFRITRYILRVFMIVFVCILIGCGPDIFSEDYKVRHLALDKINNQITLKEIASGEKHLYYEDIRLSALDKLTDSDQMFLADIATSDHNEYIRNNAIAKISDQAALTMVVLKGKSDKDRKAAFDKITDQDCLAKIAIKYPYTRWVKYFGGPAIQNPEGHANWGMYAVDKLTKQDALAEVVNEGDSVEIKLAAIDKIHDQTALGKIALENNNESVRWNVVKRLEDQTLLSLIVTKDMNSSVREAAAHALREETCITQIIIDKKCTDHEILKILFAKLNNSEFLGKIELSMADPALCIAARAVRLNEYYEYIKIFDLAINDSSKIEQTLMTIDYLKGREDTNMPSISLVCRKYIMQGKPESIPLLIKLLDVYGEKDLAEDYINCGQSDLEDAGKSWASAHGYVTRINYGSSVLHWGGMVNKR